MRLPRVLAPAAALLLALTCAMPSARADQMDPAIERLTITPPTDNAGKPIAGFTNCAPSGKYIGINCRPDNVAFARLINQYGAALAPTAMHSARTTGYGGFHLSIEGAYTGIDNNADYWVRGTQGAKDPNGGFSDRNVSPASMLQVYSLRIRKGFPLGIEIAGQIGFLAQTNIVSGGADIRWSLLEGFRKGALGILPDLAVGSGVRTITGTPQFNLTIASFDFQISKTLPIADSSIITPYVGYQQLWIFGDSGLVDVTPNTDPLGQCGYTGPNVPGNPDPSKAKTGGAFDGQPVCGANGSPLDFNNTLVFQKVRIARARFLIGLNYRYEYLWLGGQFMTDIGNPESAGQILPVMSNTDNASKLQGVPRQTTLVFELGALF